jgi:O-antigen biosynthesis protein
MTESNHTPQSEERQNEVLKRALAVSQQQIYRLERELVAVEERAERLQRLVDSILDSRIWRTLVAAGGLLLRLSGTPASPGQGGPATSGVSASDYRSWIEQFEEPDLHLNPSWVAARIATFAKRLRFSVVLAGNDPSARERTIASLDRQSYPEWEVVTGEMEPDEDYTILADAGDEFAPHALFTVADALDRQPGADLLYSDEDRLDVLGRRTNPFFKPDWSPELLQSSNYIGALLACRRGLIGQAGGLGANRESDPLLTRDHDLAMRLTARANTIIHVPRVLYHRRATADIVGRAPMSRPEITVSEHDHVAILIPTCTPSLLRQSVESIRKATAYPHYSIVVIDNSRGRAVKAFADAHQLGHCDFRGRPFNYSSLNNDAVRTTTAPLLLFLNDDTIAIEAGWLGAMVELAHKPGTGAVGARLLYPDGTIQHAGVVIGIHGTCDHAFRGLPADQPHYHGLAAATREVSAVTGACLMTPRPCFDRCGGFDEEAFPVAFQDIDYCLRVRREGYRVVYTPRATLYHHESVSIGTEKVRPERAEVEAFRRRWKTVIQCDPFYSPNLTRSTTGYGARLIFPR